MPRELVRAPGHDRDRSLGWLGIAWMEHFTRHGPGDVQGERVRHDLELSAFLADAYALDPAGRRLYDSVYFSRPKGRDKSGTAARVVLFEALGPCRFAGWAEGGERFAWRDFAYTYRPGEPMGRPVRSSFVRCLATEEGQTGNVYDAVYFNLTDQAAPLSELAGLDAGMTRTYLPGGRPGSGEVRPSTASSASKEGGLESFAVFDEPHLYRLPELVRMYATVRRNLAKRRAAEPWSLEVSTMYAPGEGSAAEATHALAKLIAQGKAASARLLFDHRQGPADVDLNDAVALRAALEEAYGGTWPSPRRAASSNPGGGRHAPTWTGSSATARRSRWASTGRCGRTRPRCGRAPPTGTCSRSGSGSARKARPGRAGRSRSARSTRPWRWRSHAGGSCAPTSTRPGTAPGSRPGRPVTATTR